MSSTSLITCFPDCFQSQGYGSAYRLPAYVQTPSARNNKKKIHMKDIVQFMPVSLVNIIVMVKNEVEKK